MLISLSSHHVTINLSMRPEATSEDNTTPRQPKHDKHACRPMKKALSNIHGQVRDVGTMYNVGHRRARQRKHLEASRIGITRQSLCDSRLFALLSITRGSGATTLLMAIHEFRFHDERGLAKMEGRG